MLNRQLPRNGFLLFELLVGLVLFSLLMILAVPPTHFLTKHLLSQEVHLLYGACFVAQSRALVMHTTEKIIFYPEKNSYTSNKCLYTLNSHSCFGTPLGSIGPEGDILHNKSPVTFPEKSIIFYPDGKTNAGSVYMRTTDNSCAYALTIGVGHTARVRIYRYEGNSWTLII